MTLFTIQKEPRRLLRIVLAVLAFAGPIGTWCLVSYSPKVWHPMMEISEPGDVSWMQTGTLVEREVFESENARMVDAGLVPAKGTPANPVYLPAPHRVLSALYRAFVTPPLRDGDPWLHQSLWHSVTVIFWGFILSSLFGVPLGILSGAFPAGRRLVEPFVEFFRYLPAPAFGALCVAVLGIGDAPKIAIVFIGTFFQQVLVIANTTRRFDPGLVEAAQVLGASPWRILTRVIVPGILPDLYKDQRILLGWAWTYLIVAEVVGESSGITWFINQQAKYRVFENVYAAILIIGFVGLATDLVLAFLGRQLFPWTGAKRNRTLQGVIAALADVPNRR